MKIDRRQREAVRQISQVAEITSEAIITVGDENDAVELIKIVATPDFDHVLYEAASYEAPLIYKVKLYSAVNLPDVIVSEFEGRAYRTAGEACDFARAKAVVLNKEYANLVKKLTSEVSTL